VSNLTSNLWFDTFLRRAYYTSAPVCAALFVTLVVAGFPRAILSDHADSSWSAVLTYAHQKGLQFGTEIVFTYGPLGFLTAPYHSGAPLGVRMLFDIALGLAVSTPLCLLAWQLKLAWRVVLLGFVILVTGNIQWEVHDLLIYVGLLCWGVLCLLESRPRLWAYLLCLTFFASFSALTKFTCAVAAVLTLGVVTVDLFARTKFRLGFAIPVSFLICFGFGWLINSQRLPGLCTFASRSLLMAEGYDQSMALKPSTGVLVCGVLTASAALAALVTGSLTTFDEEGRMRAWRRTVLLSWLVALLFLTWKHGFVRADTAHVVFFAGFAPLVPVLIQTLNGQIGATRRPVILLAVVCCGLSLATLQLALRPDHLRLLEPFRRAAQNVRDLLRPSEYAQKMNCALDQEKTRLELPALSKIAGSAPVDVFGNLQCYAFFNSLNYRPRPVFQSYAAFSAPLMRLNDQFYLSDSRPDFVLCSFHQIDRRFPPTEDALALRSLLINYDLAAIEKGMALLKSRPPVPPSLSLLMEGTVQPGERISLAQFTNLNTWLEITIDPTVVGRLRRFIYQPPEIVLALWHKPNEAAPARFHAPAPMLAAGFLSSPLVLSSRKLADLYGDGPVSRPTAYAIEIEPTARRFWKQRIHFRLYKIANAFGTCLPGSH
jgi:hypothetical protein